MPQAPNTEVLDEHLKEVVNALQQAVGWALPHINDSGVVDQAIRDCKEILDEVMAGNIAAWLD